MQRFAFVHFVGVGQPLHGLKGAAFFAVLFFAVLL